MVAGFTTAAGVENTGVQPRFELVAILEGVDNADGPRRSASLPRLGGAGDAMVDDRSGVGIRVSMRRMSCTLVMKY